MQTNVQEQQIAFEEIYSQQNQAKFGFHISDDPFVRYVRDRRLRIALDEVKRTTNEDVTEWSVLVVCGGVGGEGIFFYKNGFKDVTVSDISENSLQICRQFEKRIKTIVLNGEELNVGDGSYDLVVVQDGLHHLPRPASGFTEMLRVARKAVIVAEPYESLVGNLIGTEWEVQGGAVNYVFRWDKKMVEQVVKSYLLKNFKKIKVFRIWDHNSTVSKISKRFPVKYKLPFAKVFYGIANVFNFSGNNMVAVVLKNSVTSK